MRKLIGFLLLILTIQSLYAENYTEIRMSAGIEKKIVKGFEVQFTPEVRFRNNFRYEKFILALDAGYNLFGWVKIGGGVQGRLKDNTWTARFNADLSKSIKWGDIRIKPRIRYCNYEDFDTNLKDKTDYMRYKLQVAYHKKKNLFRPEIGMEFFHKMRNGKMSSVRYIAGGEFRISKSSSVSLTYCLEHKFKKDNFSNIIDVGYCFSF